MSELRPGCCHAPVRGVRPAAVPRVLRAAFEGQGFSSAPHYRRGDQEEDEDEKAELESDGGEGEKG